MAILDKRAKLDMEAANARRKEAAKAARLGLVFPYRIIPPPWGWLGPLESSKQASVLKK